MMKINFISYFQNNCTNNIIKLNTKHIAVLIVIGSPNNVTDNIVNIIVPKTNPINLDGHNCPLKCSTIKPTDVMNNIEIGIPNNTTAH